ncbi:competence/damage-inducible protein A [Rubrivivax gelatinosus]|uniref:Molybdopterin binding domain n=1 Tax=Rubrivivax gelatinosus (strain NBRC 100245 / IL144) TaxID=983917 RepID=I0HP40_RUBGI|nr:molybdopterin-binding protein [Rubrivivax gelatinosus]MBG6081385.1 molybdopterin-biosynthesis enzyme MoeA-like protein [Rubrivivax gelatinosus]BAL94777.1 molybdopterin binding domain [Rubrivivax gelatinosus IL144]
MNIGTIIIGDEILSGKRRDQHLAKLIEMLAARGLTLSWARYVGDERARISETLAQAFASGDLVFSFGGIGATPDDHTRQAAADALGVPLALHPEARDLILSRIREMAAEQGEPYEPDRPDNARRLHMGVFPAGAAIIPNPYNKIPGFSVGHVHFVPGFPVMAWPMVESVLDGRYGHLHQDAAPRERSVLVFGSMESTLTPLMEEIETRFAPVKVFSLPSVDHPTHGRHIELGVKGRGELVDAAYAALRDGAAALGARLGDELVR